MTDTQKAGPHHETGPYEKAATEPNSTLDGTQGRALNAVCGYALAVETGNGRYRRRLFLTLAAAENAVERARDRGQYAEIILVRLVPVEVVA